MLSANARAHTPLDRSHSQLDLPGAGLLTLGLSSLVYPLIMGREAGWPAWMLLDMAASPLVLAAFVVYERHRNEGSALIDLGLVSSAGIRRWAGNRPGVFASNGGLFILLAFYLQEGLGYTPLASGLVFTPLALGVTAGGLWAPRLAPRRSHAVLALGYAVTAAGTLALILVAGHQAPLPAATALIGPLAVIGFGQGVGVSLLMAIALRGIPDQEAGEASGVLETAIQIGMSLGVALITLIFYSLLGTAGAGADHAAFTHAFQYTLIAVMTLALLALRSCHCCDPRAKLPPNRTTCRRRRHDRCGASYHGDSKARRLTRACGIMRPVGAVSSP